jgi:hypothetical protein
MPEQLSLFPYLEHQEAPRPPDFIPVYAPDLSGHEEAYVLDAVRSGWISSLGHYVTQFEREFAAFCGVAHGVSVANGTVALKTLNALMLQIKQKFPDKTEVSVLAEPDTSYDQLVQVMDAVRAAPTSRIENGSPRIVMSELFPDIAVGDAPVRGAAAGSARATAASVAVPAAAATARPGATR